VILDEILPDAPHLARFDRLVDASVSRTWAALHEVTVDDLPLSRVLIAARSLRPRLLLGGDARPALDAFLRLGFATVREAPPSLLVLGAVGQPWKMRGSQTLQPAGGEELARFDRPGFVRMAVSFELEPLADDRTRVATETRIAPTDPGAARAFARYWSIVRLGSGAVRIDLLRAVRRRA